MKINGHSATANITTGYGSLYFSQTYPPEPPIGEEGVQTLIFPPLINDVYFIYMGTTSEDDPIVLSRINNSYEFVPDYNFHVTNGLEVSMTINGITTVGMVSIQSMDNRYLLTIIELVTIDSLIIPNLWNNYFIYESG